MSAFEDVEKLVKEWQPPALPTELQYRNALITLLRERLKMAKIEPEYRHKGTTIDIYVKQPGFLGYSEVFVELKRNLLQKSQYDRLVGQIESLEPVKNAIIVVLCGETNPSLVTRFKEKYEITNGIQIGVSISDAPITVVVKDVGTKTTAKATPRRKESKEVRALLDLHKRRIRETRIANNYYPELHRLRETFIQHGLSERSLENREFFDKWLTDPVVEMGWAPAGGWTLERITALHEDIEKLRA
jgi:hypothetical protein